jgi:3-isopropylmalate/(R)-2-methylmalate dehydratase large subunit
VPKTMLEKLWDAHVVLEPAGAPTLLYIDLHLLHEVTSPQAFDVLRARGLRVRRPERCFATVDHAVPTRDRTLPIADPVARHQIKVLEKNCRELGIVCEGVTSTRQGIVHVVGPELGLTQPGMTVVCGDSHTATHGAFGALAFGIGTSEVAQVLATQCLLQRKPRSFAVSFEGCLRPGVTAKDLVLALIARIGVGAGTGSVFEFRGPVIRGMSMEQRMTVCNMSIEGGARAGLIAPDDVTFEYLAGRPHAPQGPAWDDALERWKRLPSDPDAPFDRCVTVDASTIAPMITYGTNPAQGIGVDEAVPDPDRCSNPSERDALAKALRYMGIAPGRSLLGTPVDVVFIGSCTNARLSDLRDAATVLVGRKVSPSVRTLVVPGSQEVRRQAEAEGLADIFRAAGCEWREPGCSMCIAMNGDQLEPGQLAVSTSNRNFEGRQGSGGRTLLASPLTAAATAVSGCVADVRRL